MHKKEIAYDILAILAKHKQGFWGRYQCDRACCCCCIQAHQQDSSSTVQPYCWGRCEAHLEHVCGILRLNEGVCDSSTRNRVMALVGLW
jgi:hypothetical protein